MCVLLFVVNADKSEGGGVGRGDGKDGGVQGGSGWVEEKWAVWRRQDTGSKDIAHTHSSIKLNFSLLYSIYIVTPPTLK